jgi:4-amino-4-deoxy-L-arabinose transferase-like glycosyltransferase
VGTLRAPTFAPSHFGVKQLSIGSSRRLRWLAAWVAIAVIGLTYGIGSYGLIEPDEGRNAEVAREMAITNNYILPQLNGLPYLDKPVVFFAAAAVMIEIFGTDEFAARLAPLLFGLATACLVGWFAGRLFGREGALVAVIASLSAPLTIALSRTVIMDTALSFFVVLALIAFHQAIERRRAAQSGTDAVHVWLGWMLVAWAAMAVGVLTKGPVALAIPLIVAAPYAVWRRASLAVWHPLGPVVLAGVVSPWVWAVSRELPDFLRYVVITETWQRMTTDELRRTEPIWFFLPVLLAGAFPWSIVALSSLRTKAGDGDPERRTAWVYLMLWLLLPLIFFSLSRGKQEQYMLPLVPALALMVACRWPGRTGGYRVAAAVWGLVGAAMLGFAVLGAPGLDTARVSVDLAIGTALRLGAAAVAGSIMTWFFAPTRRQLAVIGLSMPLVALPLVCTPLIESVAGDRSVKAMAGALQPELGPDTELLWVEAYAGGLSFYLDRTIPVATADGAELRSNYILRNAERFLDDSGLLRPLTKAEKEVSECDGRTIFLLSTKSRDLGDAIESAGVETLAENRRWLAFGPDCVRVNQSPPGGQMEVE